MEERILSTRDVDAFKRHLIEDEKSSATLDKYIRDVCRFVSYFHRRVIDRQGVIEYKSFLRERYAVTSANSMLAAMNSFLSFMGWRDLCVKQFRVQKNAYSPEEKELTRADYNALVAAAAQKKNERLSLIIQTICSTGIRVSELNFVTVEALKRGEASVNCKGKTRRIFFVSALRKKLLSYIEREKIKSGPIFVTRSGRAVSRTNVWKEMKALCADAGVLPSKVFPHNLRHLFARTFYGIEKDIAKLADILGHSNINTTRIYIATTCEEHKKRMESMRLIM